MNKPVALPPPVPIEDQDSLRIGEALMVLRRHRIATMSYGLGAAILAFAFGVCRTPMFDAQATITLDLNQRTVSFDQQPVMEQNSWSFAHELLRTQRNILLSRDLLQAALRTDSLSTNPSYSGNGDPVERLHSRFSVTDNRDTWDLVLALRDEDPIHAETGLQAIIDCYKARYTDGEKAHSEAAIAFLEKQLAEAKVKMEQSREAEQSFQESKGLVVLDAEKSLPAQRLLSINSRATMLNQQLAAIDILVAQVQSIDAMSDPEQRLNAMLALELVNRHPTVVEQQRLLFELRSKESELGQKFLDKHPRMIEIRSEIATKLSQLQQIVASIRWGVLSDRAKIAAQIISEKDEKSRAEATFSEYRENLFHLQTLSQETRTDAGLYDHLLKRLGEERIAENLDHQQLSVTDSPTASSQPSNIHISLSIIAAVLCGGFCGILAPFVLELLGRRANSAAEVHAIIGRPVLGELPYVPALTVLGAHGDPNQPIMLTEAVRGLRTALRMRQAESDVGECLVIASCDGGDGKSTVAARLAMSMAQSGRKVLLVDGDLRRPSLHTQLGQTCEQGLSRLLAGEPGISPAETTYSNLSFLDAGDPTAQPGELLNSHCLLEWLNQCRKQFDDIVIDTPPLSMFADGLIIGGCADRILLVVREGATLKDSLVHVHELLAPLQDKLAGIAILNRPGTAQSVGIYRRQETLTVANPEAAATVGAGADMPQT